MLSSKNIKYDNKQDFKMYFLIEKFSGLFMYHLKKIPMFNLNETIIQWTNWIYTIGKHSFY